MGAGADLIFRIWPEDGVSLMLIVVIHRHALFRKINTDLIQITRRWCSRPHYAMGPLKNRKDNPLNDQGDGGANQEQRRRRSACPDALSGKRARRTGSGTSVIKNVINTWMKHRHGRLYVGLCTVVMICDFTVRGPVDAEGWRSRTTPFRSTPTGAALGVGA